MQAVKDHFISITSDFKAFYLGIWVFVTLLHAASLYAFFGGGHTVISAVFSCLIVLIGLWEVVSVIRWNDGYKFLASNVNTEALVGIVTLHLLFAGVHLMGLNTYEFNEVRSYWIVPAGALCALIFRIDIDPGAGR